MGICTSTSLCSLSRVEDCRSKYLTFMTAKISHTLMWARLPVAQSSGSVCLEHSLRHRLPIANGESRHRYPTRRVHFEGARLSLERIVQVGHLTSILRTPTQSRMEAVIQQTRYCGRRRVSTLLI